MLHLTIAILCAALVYWLLTALGLPTLIAIAIAILIVLAGIANTGLNRRL